MNFGERPFVYGDGREHRDAANVQEQDTTEEVSGSCVATAREGGVATAREGGVATSQGRGCGY